MISEILRLKQERNILILAHYYQTMDIQNIADAVGDSFELSRRAAAAEQNTLVFCGVRFMAESAKILAPRKKVILPEPNAGCPLADMITAKDVLELREKHPKAAVMTYVNTSAEIKALSDICCTSSSAERVARSLSEDEIIFVPDKNLGSYIASLIPEKRFIFFDGNCPIHHKVAPEDVVYARERHPDAKIILHPECPIEAVSLADGAGSTAWILEQVENSPKGSKFVVGTELGIVERLKETAPGRECFLLRPDLLCENMKITTLRSLLAALNGSGGEVIELDEAIMNKARNSLQRMLDV